MFQSFRVLNRVDRPKSGFVLIKSIPALLQTSSLAPKHGRTAFLGLMTVLPLVLSGCGKSTQTDQTPTSRSLSPTTHILSQAPTSDQQRPKLTPAPDTAAMMLVPGGHTLIGSEEGLTQEQPTFWIAIKPFRIDTHPVTVAEFRQFVAASGYRTEAERFGDAGVFNEQTRQWTLVKGANWQYPRGPDQPKAPDNHPVTQVSWNDAQAYARWAGKRLPTELEWEHAARNGRNDRAIYPFGNELVVNNRPMANTWNGKFPEYNQNTDGFLHTSPVGHFGKTPLGLTDMSGNVWQWCDNWRFNYGDLKAGQSLPTSGQEKAMRGGSFLCEPGWCHGYRVSGRSFSSPETALMHVGFRCVKDV